MIRPRCPEHHHRAPCPMCRSEHLAEHTTPRTGCDWCTIPDPQPETARAAARDQEDLT
jgi:hypothetical protein